MDGRPQPQLLQPEQNLGRLFLLQNLDQFHHQPVGVGLAQGAQLDGVLEQVVGQLADGETVALFEPDRPEAAGGVLHEGEGVEHPQGLFLEVPLAPEVVDQNAEVGLVQLQGQGVDGEVPAVQVQLQGRGLHDGQGRRGLVMLQPGRGHVDLEPVGQDHHRGPELLVIPHPGPVALSELLGEPDPVASTTTSTSRLSRRSSRSRTNPPTA